MQKIQSLESLRGFAAFSVVLAHIAFAFFPAMVVGSSSAVTHSSFESIILHSPLNAFIGGNFAVICFFVLSGFVLSYGFFSKKRFDLVSAALRRYFRLAPIVLVSVLMAYFLLKLGLFHNDTGAAISQSDWLKQFWRDDSATLLDALSAGLVGAFAIMPTPQSLNPVLWTIYYELIGSMIVYAVLALLGRDRRRWILYTILLIILPGSYFFGFIVGMVLCDLFVNKPGVIKWFANLHVVYKVVLLFVAIYFASYPAYIIAPTDYGVIHQSIQIFSENNVTRNILYAVSSAIIITMLISGSRLNRVLEWKPFVYLGSISYSLYATHLLVLGSFGCGMLVLFSGMLPYNYAAALAALLFIIVTIIVAALFRSYVDLPSIKLGRIIVPNNPKK